MFLKKPLSTEAYEGDNVVIACEVIGDPKPELFWLRDFLKVRVTTNLLRLLCRFSSLGKKERVPFSVRRR